MGSGNTGHAYEITGVETTTTGVNLFLKDSITGEVNLRPAGSTGIDPESIVGVKKQGTDW